MRIIQMCTIYGTVIFDIALYLYMCTVYGTGYVTSVIQHLLCNTCYITFVMFKPNDSNKHIFYKYFIL